MATPSPQITQTSSFYEVGTDFYNAKTDLELSSAMLLCAGGVGF